MNNLIEYYGLYCMNIFWMNIPDFVLNWIILGPIQWKNEFSKKIAHPYTEEEIFYHAKLFKWYGVLLHLGFWLKTTSLRRVQFKLLVISDWSLHCLCSQRPFLQKNLFCWQPFLDEDEKRCHLSFYCVAHTPKPLSCHKHPPWFVSKSDRFSA